jgi:XTP/dITP diphosphohydrolase
MRFFIGTTNPHKIREIGSILSAVGCEFTPTDPIDPEETSSDFVENAVIKAVAYARHAGGMTISEDSGLIVPALGGLPGPWSARFSDYAVIDASKGRVAGYAPTGSAREEIDRFNNKLVLALMRDIEQPRRAAAFRVALIVAESDGTVLFKGLGESHGWIAEEPRGTHGFGYDPIFIGGDTFGKTYAELDPARKNLRSHRRRVLQEFKAWLAGKIKESDDAHRG